MQKAALFASLLFFILLLCIRCADTNGANRLKHAEYDISQIITSFISILLAQFWEIKVRYL